MAFQNQEEFEKLLIKEYFLCGSINKVFQKFRYDLPISFAGYHRVLDKHKIIKSAGPNSKLSESLYFLSLIANYKVPLEKIYHQLAPQTIQVSTNTLHRVLHYTRLGLTRRQGVALLISSSKTPQKFLVGNDLSLANSQLGNKGDLSLPMGFSKTGEPISDAIARVLQNEVFTDNTIAGNFPWEIIPKHNKPLMFINIADIRVSVYALIIPPKYTQFSSFKLQHIRYEGIKKIMGQKTRPGVKEILTNYETTLQNHNENFEINLNSELNQKIYALVEEPVR